MSGAVNEGGCLCGAVRYRVSGGPDHVVHCHCTMCRKAAGAPVTTWAVVQRDRLEWTKGEPAVYRSSAHAERGYCASCGGQLTFRSDKRPDDIDLSIGTLDDPATFPPQYHIWTSSKIPWLRLDEHLPAYEETAPD